MNLKYIFFLLMLITFNTKAQETPFLIANDVVDYSVDALGNVYFIDSKNVLTKFEPSVPRYTKYADLRSGRIHSIDVSNPLRVLVFYGDQMVIRFLDVNLTEINSFQIKTAYPQGWIRLACTSNNNGIWLYDELSRKLIKVAEQLITQFETGDLFLVTSKKINPNFILEYGDELYLNDPKLGLFVFDLFGGYKRTVPVYGASFIQRYKDKIYFQDDKQWLVYQGMRTDTIINDLNGFKKPVFSAAGTYFLQGKDLILKQEK